MNTPPGSRHQFYSGLSGLQLPVPKYLFPPEFKNASRLTYYASYFNSIEFNSTFYKIPQPATVGKWSAMVPEGFRFTFKLWKEITHSKGFNFNKEDVVAFFNSINAVKEKKGCLLIQFPPSIGREYARQLGNLLSCINDIDPANEWKVAVEFRNTSWYHEDVYDLLNFYKATMVIQDIPKSATPLINQKSGFLYLRFHGPTGNYRESYSEEFLKEYAALINAWREEGKTVFAYFNNTMGDAFDNLTTLNRFVQ
ncbi:DUF72 domain-containing protein [Antarcticibacterium flavum]|uniref:DUF72 domain-containing protein n=1 Tax=Antarcticibacterium flavum TaxID=2058175 RepID=A0A5B7X1C8_9FLAO|nr:MULTISPECIES: DUF72 domain-containing protein [Antarcticibacterium]MCM4161758.1 DUF72 domain-containing protein [Antarcticibacterium sp. W02-3]QCY68413.1 DUF72 domain-containing protein [Antarcticibacterium flavum]